MPRYRVEPHNLQGPFSEKGQGSGPELESRDTTFSDDGGEVMFFSGYSARQMAERRQREAGGTIYVNSVSRRIVNPDFQGATNAPTYYAVAVSPVYTLIRHEDKVVRAYWPTLGS